MELIEKKFNISLKIEKYIDIKVYDDYIEHIIGVDSGIPHTFLIQMDRNTKIEYKSNGIRIHAYYIFDYSPAEVFNVFTKLSTYQIVKWNCPPNGFDRFYSILLGCIEVYTFGVYNDYVFPDEKVSILCHHEFGFKIDDYISSEYNLSN